jgi:hypothetical protein
VSLSLQGLLYLLQVKIPARHHAAFEILVGAQCVKVDESPFRDDDESGSIEIEYITVQVWTKFNLREQTRTVSVQHVRHGTQIEPHAQRLTKFGRHQRAN